MVGLPSNETNLFNEFDFYTEFRVCKVSNESSKRDLGVKICAILSALGAWLKVIL